MPLDSGLAEPGSARPGPPRVGPRPFGATGLVVPPVGLGAMQLGDPAMPESEAARLLHGALDLGCRLIDTARSYGLSEARIGRVLERRRDEFVLSTKVGYGVEGVPDWTPESVRLGVDAARDRLRTDFLDIVHLHSCDLGTLQHAGVVEALLDAVAAGKVRVAAYSGEGAALDWAVAQEGIGAIQLSVNLCDQRSLDGVIPAARAMGKGVLAKRPLATAPWQGAGAQPVYAERFELIAPELPGQVADWAELALRFSLFAPGVDACIVGTRRLPHLEAALHAASQGPLPSEWNASLGSTFRRLGAGWTGLV
jgi:aryl-alcohol dehydrogenase-like predicted oxidoreductase